MYLRWSLRFTKRSLGSAAPRLAALSMLALSAIGGQASAQTAAAPAPPQPVQELPQVEVTTTPQPKKTVKAKAKPKKAPPVQTSGAPSPATPADNLAATGAATATKPGLNLDVPDQTGSRLGLTPLETPASIEVIPGVTIRERGQNSVVDAVTQNATGFTSTASPGNGGTSLGTRGFVGHGSVMQLYDGTRMYVAAETLTFPFNTWSAERIEVLRGPASVLYGEGAIGGVINVVPKKPTDYFTNEAEISYGTDATKRFGVGSGGPIGEQLAYRIDAAGTQSDGWLDPEGDFSDLALSGAVSYRPMRDLRFTISHDYGDQSPMRYNGTPLINGVIPDAIRFTNFNVADSDVHFLDNWSQIKTEWRPNEWFEVRNVAYRLASKRHWRNAESFAYQDSGPNAGLIERTAYFEIFHEQEQIGNRFDATLRTPLMETAKNEVLVGFDVNRIEFRHTNNFDDDGLSYVDPFNFVPGSFLNPGTTYPKFDTDTSQYSLFAEDRLTLSEELSIVAGIRLEHPSIERENLVTGSSFEKTFSDVTWRAGAVYTPIRDVAFYGQYATGVDQVGSGIVTLSQFASDFELATARQIEIGVKQIFWGGRGEWTLAGYDIEKQNLLSADPNDTQNIRQVGQQSSRGVEVAVALQLTDTLRYEGNVAVLQARYDEFVDPDSGADFADHRPNNVPEQIVNNWLSWAFLPQWEGHVGVRWVGSMYGDDANTYKRPGFTVVNVGLDYDVTENSEIALRVYNVFDELYAVYGDSTQWQLAPPRTGELVYRVKY
jgi:iron complex outermembrane recepter protein